MVSVVFSQLNLLASLASLLTLMTIDVGFNYDVNYAFWEEPRTMWRVTNVSKIVV